MELHHRAFPAILLAIALAGCNSPSAPGMNQPVTPIAGGTFSSGDASQRLVVRSQTDLTAVWNELFAFESMPPPIPTVDFSQEMVIVARAGFKATSGYCIVVDSAAGSSRSMTVRVRSGHPSPTSVVMEVVTHPYAVVRVPRSDEVAFTETSVVGACLTAIPVAR